MARVTEDFRRLPASTAHRRWNRRRRGTELSGLHILVFFLIFFRNIAMSSEWRFNQNLQGAHGRIDNRPQCATIDLEAPIAHGLPNRQSILCFLKKLSSEPCLHLCLLISNTTYSACIYWSVCLRLQIFTNKHRYISSNPNNISRYFPLIGDEIVWPWPLT
jgi:hypothetical protein